MNMDNLKYEVLHVSITPQQAEKMKEVKEGTGLRTSEIVRRALDLFFKEYKNNE